MKEEDKPVTSALPDGTEAVNPLLNKILQTVKKIADAHNIGIVMFASIPTGEVAMINGRPSMGTESSLLVHGMNEQNSYVFGQTLGRTKGLADACAIGWRDSVLKHPVNQNEAVKPTVTADTDSSTVH